MKKILLADDSITIQKVVELTFSEGDYQVICVSNGAQALKKIPEVQPDIVLLDVIMPEKNGYEVCEELKKNTATRFIPVLLLTGTFEPFDQQRAEAVGAGGHLTKPFESQTLVTKVEELIAMRPEVSRDPAPGMDIESGGKSHHIDSPGPGVQPFADPIAESPESGAMEGAIGEAEPVNPLPPTPPTAGFGEEKQETPPISPSLGAADPTDGGSYLGFADVGDGMEEPEIIPDRFDAEPAPDSTQRIDRGSLMEGLGAAPGDPGEERSDDSRFSGEGIDGLTGGFEIQDLSPQMEVPGEPETPESEFGDPGIDATEVAEPYTGETAAWSAPEEAQPVEALREPETSSGNWQAEGRSAGAVNPPDTGSESWSPDLAGPPSAPAGSAGSADSGGADGLTPEAIDLIAEKVVQQLSDRIVREIAWEVIPQVAEELVRRRIKELEDNEGK